MIDESGKFFIFDLNSCQLKTRIESKINSRDKWFNTYGLNDFDGNIYFRYHLPNGDKS
jgi:hypothetical protein